MSDWQIDTIDVPEDLEWPDRSWIGKRQGDYLSTAGTSITQVSRQHTGRPITLQTPIDHPVRRALCEALQAHADDDQIGVFTVTTPEGEQHQCRYRWSDGLPVEYAPVYHQSPADPDDLCTLIIRLKTV
jgi:hypothetical protein